MIRQNGRTPADHLKPTVAARFARVRFVAFDFDGVFTDNSVYTFEDGREAVRCSRYDGFGLDRLRRLGIGLAVISTEKNPVVAARCRKLRLDCLQACEDKVAALERLLTTRGVTWDAAAFVGNDVNDLPCLQRVGLPIVVRDAHPAVHDHALYRTRTPGGQGAVREICDLLAELQEAEAAKAQAPAQAD